MTADELPLVRVEWAGLVQDRFRDGNLANVVKLGRDLNTFRLVLGKSETLGGHSRELSDHAGMFAQARAALRERLQQYIGALTSGRGAPGLAPVHALVGHAERVHRSGCVLRKARHAGGAANREPLALLTQRTCGTPGDFGAGVRIDRNERAELVAAHAIRATGPLVYMLQLAAEAGEHRVTC